MAASPGAPRAPRAPRGSKVQSFTTGRTARPSLLGTRTAEAARLARCTSRTRTWRTSPTFPALEREVLAYWAQDGTFEASVKARSEANGVRLLRRAAVRQRPAALRPPPDGFREGRRPSLQDDARLAGGKALRLGLPRAARPEMEAVKELDLPGRADIERYGIARFNDYCRTSVLRYTSEWERYVTRQARWVDFANDYKTMDLSYMESVMWAFSQLYKKGLAVRGLPGAAVIAGSARHRSPISRPARTTPTGLARTRRSRSLSSSSASRPGPRRRGTFRRRACRCTPLVWTTTPWTLPSNLASAVGPRHHLRRAEVDRGPLPRGRGAPGGAGRSSLGAALARGARVWPR